MQDNRVFAKLYYIETAGYQAAKWFYTRVKATMKTKIHPKYYTNCKVKCACGNEFELGATKENLEIEVCHKCHPFYTGDERGKIRGSQVEKFKERIGKKIAAPKQKVKRARK